MKPERPERKADGMLAPAPWLGHWSVVATLKNATRNLLHAILRNRIATNRQFLFVAPSFNCGCVDWYSASDAPALLRRLLHLLNLGDERFVTYRVFTLRCREHGSKRDKLRFRIPRDSSWCSFFHKLAQWPNAEVSDRRPAASESSETHNGGSLH